MKAPILGLLLAAAALAGAQPFTVLLNNPEESDFYFTLDPKELSGFDPAASIFPSVVFDYFAEVPPAGWPGFQPLPAGATRRLEGLAEGSHLVVGFFALRNRTEFPVRTLTVRAGGGMSERLYSIYSEPSLFKARVGRGRLASFAPAEMPAEGAAIRPPVEGRLNIVIENKYEDWEAIPVLSSFTDYQPASFSREQYGTPSQVQPLSEARYWQKGGTSLAELKAAQEDRTLYLLLSTRSAIADGLSIFIYFHDPKDRPEENRVTVELVPATGGRPGLVVLWVKDKAPVPAGELASGSFFLEASVNLALVDAALVSRLEISSLELTTCFRDRLALVYEEFYYTTLALKEIPTLDRLYAPKD